MSKSIPSRSKSSARWTTVTGLGAATWIVTSPLTGCATPDSPADAENGAAEAVQNLDAEGRGAMTDHGEGHDAMALSGEGEGEGGEGEGEGEGEGGEGEGEGAGSGVDLATDDTAYLTQLGLIRGHLEVGYALYEAGKPELAQTHMKHPRAEIYTEIEPAFARRGCPGFGNGLSALTAAVIGNAPLDQVTDAYEAVSASIQGCERTASVSDPATIAGVIENLLRTAGVEYQIGVIDGKIDNLHEYQDAWGFTQVAADWATASAFGKSGKTASVAAQIQSIVRSVEPLWPALDPAGDIDGDAAQLFGAAGRVSVAAAGLSR